MVAVWTSATMSGVPASVVISQAAPTPWTSQPVEPIRLAPQIAAEHGQPQRREDAPAMPRLCLPACRHPPHLGQRRSAGKLARAHGHGYAERPPPSSGQA